ncbi:zinc ribbon domain-containing protein [Micromonospora sp. NPDC003776]
MRADHEGGQHPVSGPERKEGGGVRLWRSAWEQFDLVRIIGYRQRWRGGHTTRAPRWYPSTRMCSACRTTGPALPLQVRVFCCHECGHTADRDINAAVNLAVWAEQHHAQTRDPEARGPVTNASREDGSGQRPRAGETSLNDGGTPPPRTPVTARTPEKGGAS